MCQGVVFFEPLARFPLVPVIGHLDGQRVCCAAFMYKRAVNLHT